MTNIFLKNRHWHKTLLVLQPQGESTIIIFVHGLTCHFHSRARLFVEKAKEEVKEAPWRLNLPKPVKVIEPE
jgi:hypothetical protein